MPIQTAVTLNHLQGFPGQVDGIDYHINGEFSVATGFTVAAGQLVEVVAGTQTVRPMQSTTTVDDCYGVAVYTPMKQPNPLGTTYGEYVAGDKVRILRKGRAYTFWTGSTTPAFNTVPNISHSSTSAGLNTVAAQGSLTDTATSTTAGSEITTALAGIRLVANPSSLVAGLCLAEFNLPG